ncbi:MAG TPA: hypothetical protein DCZ93_03995 [Elusimicrobia bacterium]|nr:hypothetical protein [Elusimicrobiota bacterium]
MTFLPVTESEVPESLNSTSGGGDSGVSVEAATSWIGLSSARLKRPVSICSLTLFQAPGEYSGGVIASRSGSASGGFSSEPVFSSRPGSDRSSSRKRAVPVEGDARYGSPARAGPGNTASARNRIVKFFFTLKTENPLLAPVT